MRILIAGISYEDSFADNVSSSLRLMGHDTLTLGEVAHARYYSPLRHYSRAIIERLRKRSISPDGRRLLRLARSFRPQIVLSLTREYPPELLAELKRVCGSVLILWWGDPPANARRWAFMDPSWDLVFLKDMATVKKLRLVRSDVHLLHEAMNPKWHRPLSKQQNERVIVAGNYYPFRQALVSRLLADGTDMDLYGSPPPWWSFPTIRSRHTGRYIVRDEKSRIFGAGAACLNSFSVAEGNSLNCRAFEIAGAGGLQVVEYRPAIEECFEPGKELLVFRTYEELLELIEWARSAPNEMSRIREDGARRALSEHTYQHRLEAMLGYL